MYTDTIRFVCWGNQFWISIRLQLYIGPIMYYNLKNTSLMSVLVSLRHFYNEKCHRGSYQLFCSSNMHILLAAGNTQQKPCVVSKYIIMNILIANDVICDSTDCSGGGVASGWCCWIHRPRHGPPTRARQSTYGLSRGWTCAVPPRRSAILRELPTTNTMLQH